LSSDAGTNLYLYFYVSSVVVGTDVSGIHLYEGGTSHTEDLDTQKIQLEEWTSPRKGKVQLTDNFSTDPG